MTDETRSELRRVIEAAVRAGGADTSFRELPGGAGNYYELSVFSAIVFDRPALTSAQQLALSVLLGDESVVPQVLADYLLDQGHEYATACYERGRAEAFQGTLSSRQISGEVVRAEDVAALIRALGDAT